MLGAAKNMSYKVLDLDLMDTCPSRFNLINSCQLEKHCH